MPMPVRASLLAVLLVLLSAPATAAPEGTATGGKTINGVPVPGTLDRAGQELVLNGAGVRSKWFIDAYVGALYLSRREADAHQIIDADQPMAITLRITTRFITPRRMQSATLEGFRKATDDHVGPIKAKVERLIHVFDHRIHDGDVYTLLYVPHQGTSAYRNGTLELTVKGLEFKRALFAIWLGERPADAGLKRAMLGANRG